MAHVKIKHIRVISADGDALLHPEDESLEPIAVYDGFVDKHGCQPGGFYIHRDDGPTWSVEDPTPPAA